MFEPQPDSDEEPVVHHNLGEKIFLFVQDEHNYPQLQLYAASYSWMEIVCFPGTG